MSFAENLRDRVADQTPDSVTPFEEVVARARRRRRRQVSAVVAATGAVAAIAIVVPALTGGGAPHQVTGSGQTSEPTTSTTPTTDSTPGTPTSVPTSTDGPTGEMPNLVLQLEDREVALRAWTACWGNGCVDGFPPPDLAQVGSPDQVIAWSPEADMRWSVTFVETGVKDKCARSISYSAKPYDGHHVLLEPAGPAGSYRVDVFGRAPSGGDVVYSFGWTTPTAGRAPKPAAGIAAVLADHDGKLDSYGVELSISDLATQPASAEATITVTSSTGESVQFVPRGPGACTDAGNLFFTLRDGSAATRIGPGPFTYSVDLVLDGTHYTGTGRYPDDVQKGNEPSVRLTWDPPLPSYTVK
ncbi:MAG: hypothetical protein QM714_07600 [Nocardioides sp.]|uniref:hypothetical protein n=1 Tax=Nocardioides sp. TaxID=35761 RepID=UPI0039E566CE